MRRLVLMRHGKAERGEGKDDFDRTLVERGWKEAGEVAAAFTAAGIAPDQVLCSASRRTRDTLCAVLPYLAADCTVALRRDLYEAGAAELRAAVAGADGEAVLVIGHNPAIHRLAAELAASSPEAHLLADGFPTSYAALFSVPSGLEAARFERLFSR